MADRPKEEDEELRKLLLAILEGAPKNMSPEELAETVRKVMEAATT
jgi:hypothetical protein